jgi:hypothetical protein
MLDKCIYCGKKLDGSNEHILQESLGSSLKSSKIVCSTCNCRFGKTIDKPFSDFYALLCNQLGIKGKSSSNVSQKFGKQITLRNSANGKKLTIDGDQRIGSQEKPRVKLDKDAQGKIISGSVSGTNRDAVDKVIKSISKGQDNDITMEIISQKIETIEPDSFFDTLEIANSHFKGIKKSILNLIAYKYPHQLCNDGLIDSARDIYESSILIENGREDDVVPEPVQPMFSLDRLPDQLIQHSTGDINHILAICFNNKDNSIIGVARLFSYFYYGFILSEEYSGEESTLCYIIDPLPDAENLNHTVIINEAILSKHDLVSLPFGKPLGCKIKNAISELSPSMARKSLEIAIYSKANKLYYPAHVPVGRLRDNIEISSEAVYRLLKLCTKAVLDETILNDLILSDEIDQLLKNSSNELINSIIEQQPEFIVNKYSQSSIGQHAVKFFFTIMAQQLEILSRTIK